MSTFPFQAESEELVNKNKLFSCIIFINFDFYAKIGHFQKQGDFSGKRETASKTGSLPAKKRGVTALLCDGINMLETAFEWWMPDMHALALRIDQTPKCRSLHTTV